MEGLWGLLKIEKEWLGSIFWGSNIWLKFEREVGVSEVKNILDKGDSMCKGFKVIGSYVVLRLREC